MASASRTEQRDMESILEILVVVTMAGNVHTSVSHYKNEQEHCYILYEIKYEESCHQELEQVRMGNQVWFYKFIGGHIKLKIKIIS